MTTGPTVGVGVPVYNGEQYLEACITSLLEQTHHIDEIVISDNCSTDGTVTIARALARTHPSVRLVEQTENRGAAANYNLLVDACRTDLFAWAAADDLYGPQLVAAQVAALADPDVVLAYGRTENIDQDGAPLDPPSAITWSDRRDPVGRVQELFADRHHSHLHDCSAVLGLTRRDVLADTGRIRPFGGSDKVLLFELALQGRLTPVDAAFLRRRHAASSVAANPDSESRRRWFDPSAAGPATPHSDVAGAMLRAVGGAPLTRRQRATIASLVVGWAAEGRGWRVTAGETRRRVVHSAAQSVARIRKRL